MIGRLFRWAPVGAVVLAAMAAGQLNAAHPTSQWPTIKWLAMPELDHTKSSTNCGDRHTEPVELVLEGNVLKSTAWSGMTYDMILQEPLNADGSGKVRAIAMPKGRTLILEFEKFDPRRGPPSITFYGLYNAVKGNGRCVWTFRPLVDPD